MYIPLCPTVERLNLGKSDLRSIMQPESINSKLIKRVYRNLRSALPVETFQCLRQMEGGDDEGVESLSKFGSCSKGVHPPYGHLSLTDALN